MPFTVQQLILDHQRPQTVFAADPLPRALELMAEYEYSQLPVVDGNDRPLGLVTSDSILRALNHFTVTPSDLRVADAMIRAVTKRNDEDLFDLLDDLRDTYAILIVDGEGLLVGIVTNYDTTDYFRRRTEDIMFVQDVETMVKEFVLAAFTNTDSELELESLAAAIVDITPSDKALRIRFRNALMCYLELKGDQPQPQHQWLEQAFTAHLEVKSGPRSLDDLTLYDLNQLFLHDQRWPFYRATFSLKPDAIRRLLDPVRQTRNALAHLREITPQQREQLHFCKEWLAGHQPPSPILAPSQPVVQPVDLPLVEPFTDAAAPEVASDPDDIQPVEEIAVPGESRYEELARWLKRQPRRDERVQLSFREVEEIIDTELPPSARRHRAWWANDSVSHVQSLSWLSADWRVASINMSEERVIFARIREREIAYIDFFSALISNLNQAAPVFRSPSPDGQSWIVPARVVVEKRVLGFFSFSFTRDARFRVELYLDSGDPVINKKLFTHLSESYQKRDLSAELPGERFSWEELPDKRASRIAIYHPGSITRPAEELAALREWAIPVMIRFYALFGDFEATVQQLAASGDTVVAAFLARND